MAFIEKLKELYILKGVGIPEYYLGGDVEQLNKHWTADNVSMALLAKMYIKNCISKFEELIGTQIETFKTLMAEGLHPEIDDSPLCGERDHAIYRSILGSLNWIITLGRFDVSYATSALSQSAMAPCEGHLKAAI